MREYWTNCCLATSSDEAVELAPLDIKVSALKDQRLKLTHIW